MMKRFESPFVRGIKSGYLLTMRDRFYDIEVEITVNKTVELYNSALLYTYAACDFRFYQLVIFLKKWNKS